MTDYVDRFRAAVKMLAGHGHIKQRLIKAFDENLADIQAEELPVALKQDFADLKVSMYRVSPLNGEGPVCASVRKMSIEEACDCAEAVVTLFAEIARQQDPARESIALQQDESERVPAFLVKSV